MPPFATRLIASLALALSASAQAGPLPQIAFISMGYRELTMDSLPANAHLAQRKLDPTGFLALTADFNGDGQDDEVRILGNPEQNSARIVAVIQSSDKIDTYVLNSFPFAESGQLGIQLAPAAPEQGRPLAGIIVFRFNGAAECNMLVDGEFERVAMPANWTSPTNGAGI